MYMLINCDFTLCFMGILLCSESCNTRSSVIRKMRGFHCSNLCKQSFWWEKGLIISYLDNWAMFAQRIGTQLYCRECKINITCNISKLKLSYLLLVHMLLLQLLLDIIRIQDWVRNPSHQEMDLCLFFSKQRKRSIWSVKVCVLN